MSGKTDQSSQAFESDESYFGRVGAELAEHYVAVFFKSWDPVAELEEDHQRKVAIPSSNPHQCQTCNEIQSVRC